MQTTNHNNKDNTKILFFLWPFLTFIRAFLFYHKSWSKNIVWAFIIYFGFTFVISGEGADANRYRDWFQLMGRQDISFGAFVNSLYSYGSRYLDVAQPFIIFFLSKITNDSRILFAVFGLILGFFYSRNIWYLLEHSGQSLRKASLPLIIIFALLIGFWQINGFRFWTAAHIFLYGVLPYLIEGDKKRLWLAGLSIFFHFSFVLPIGVLLLYLFLGNRFHFYFYFFIVSLFIYEIDFQFIKNLTQNLPEIFQERSDLYLNNRYAEERRLAVLNKSWHARYYLDALRLALETLIIFTYINVRGLTRKNNWLIPLFSFSLLFTGIFNILGNIPSVGRFINLSNMFFASFLFLYFQFDKTNPHKERLLFCLMPLILLFCVVSVRTGLDYMGIYTFFGNPVIALLGPGEVSAMDYIKAFLK